MAFIVASLRDSDRHINASRPLTEANSDSEIAKRRKITSSIVNTNPDNLKVINDTGSSQQEENVGLYKPLVKLSSRLGALSKCTETLLEVSSKNMV